MASVKILRYIEFSSLPEAALKASFAPFKKQDLLFCFQCPVNCALGICPKRSSAPRSLFG